MIQRCHIWEGIQQLSITIAPNILVNENPPRHRHLHHPPRTRNQ
jgi:hypothetical protein